MTDIVERLRGSCEDGIQPDDVYEAAAEIERLRGELHTLAGRIDDFEHVIVPAWKREEDASDAEIARLRGLLARIDNCDAITIDRDFPQANVDEAEAIWDEIHAALAGTAIQPSAGQPERCCLDYPRCDCNSPPEPDDDWLCFQRPAQPKVTP